MRNVTVMRGSDTPKDTFLQVDGARLRYRDEGRGFAVMLLHGWALDLDMWQPQVDAWCERFRTVRFDRRGFGSSSGTPSIEDDMRDVQAVADRLGIARFALLGMSQAGRVALQAAAGLLRARLTCLILDGAPAEGALPEDGAPEEISLSHYREVVLRHGLEAFRKEWNAHPFTQLHSADFMARDLLRRITARYPGSDLLAPMLAAESKADPFPLRSLRMATLVINGELDTERRRTMGAALRDAIPHAERAIIRGCGHLPNLDNPREYNAVIERFIARHVRQT